MSKRFFYSLTASAVALASVSAENLILPATGFQPGEGAYLDKNDWMTVDPGKAESATANGAFPFPSGRYHITFQAIGEDDGQSVFTLRINGVALPEYTVGLASKTFDDSPDFGTTFENVEIGTGDVIEVISQIHSADGREFARGRWEKMTFTPADEATEKAVSEAQAKEAAAIPKRPALQEPRAADGDNSVSLAGRNTVWFPTTLTLNGPFAHELDTQPNPFTDYRLTLSCKHEDGEASYTVPGYFAADGNAAESSAQSGTMWRAHFTPDRPGKWTYILKLERGADIAIDPEAKGDILTVQEGEFEILEADSGAAGFRSHGRLAYNGSRYLRFAGSGKPFFKAGADAPETLLGYAEFDGTVANKPKKVPLKTFQPHLQDWREGSPVWKGDKGKGIIGALNYLSDKGVNAVSFLTYNAGGDGDNVWPFTSRDEKFHYDCSKLDQWDIVFSHADDIGLYLHFKTQETENDDNTGGHNSQYVKVPTSLDGGDLGRERKLYYRELIARFGHHLALNWNIGEENTQTAKQQLDAAGYIAALDSYDHHIVIHTYPGQQEQVYRPLLGPDSPYTGASLQNDWSAVHRRTRQWLKESEEAGKIWVVANDEQGTAATGTPPDTGYKGFVEAKDKDRTWTMHDIRKDVLWGNLMAGGAGVEYYFGYELAENDLVAEDWRSRDKTWEYAAIAIKFFNENAEEIATLQSRDDLIGNPEGWNNGYCSISDSAAYIYLPDGGEKNIEFDAKTITWFNPRTGEQQEPKDWAGSKVTAPDQEDWLAILR